MRRWLLGACFLVGACGLQVSAGETLERVGTQFFDKGFAALASFDGQFYLVANEKLQRVDATTGAVQRVGKLYFDKGQVALGSHGGALYVLGKEELYRASAP